MMEQFEKVCNGLQTAVDSDWMWRKADYIAMCCKDALALIRQQQERIAELEAAQTARVMTLEEVKTLNHNTAVWYEHKGVNPPRPRVVHYASDDHITFTDGSTLNFEMDGYGSHWRCWTQRPTDEQREKVKWDD